VFCSFVSNKTSKRPNVAKLGNMCHENCGGGCDLLPTPGNHNCLSCPVGLNSSGNNCEEVCTAPNTYINSDYTACINCPICCPTCNFLVTPTWPQIPDPNNLECNGSLHPDYNFVDGNCNLKAYEINLNRDDETG
jgi:hypothetical protein